jgi:hypothetical protein
MVASRKIQKFPDLGSVPVETGVVVYRCRTCNFESMDPQAASDHDVAENKGRRRSSEWRHEIEVVAARDPAASPCPVCSASSYNALDLKSHLVQEHGGNPDVLVDLVLLLRDQNNRLTGLARTLHAQVRNLMRPNLLVPRKRLNLNKAAEDDALEASR